METWGKAKESCEKGQNSLALVGNEDINSFLKNLAGDDIVWVGGRQTENATEPAAGWEWTDGVLFGEFQKWDTTLGSQPDNDKGNENCLQMGGLWNDWNDAGCSDPAKFVCQYEDTPSKQIAKCLVKANHTISKEKMLANVSNIKSLKKCALGCSKYSSCLMFTWIKDQKSCLFFSQGALSRTLSNLTSGLCPKDDINLNSSKIEPKLREAMSLLDSKPKLRCSSEKLCNLPFKFNGIYQFDCVDGGDGKTYCNTDPNIHTTVVDYRNISRLSECRPCDGKQNTTKLTFSIILFSSGNCPFNSTEHVGFPLKNQDGSNGYGSVSLSECQKLCNFTNFCFFFNYDFKLRRCFLKVGVGKRKTNKVHMTFGPAACPGPGLTLLC